MIQKKQYETKRPPEKEMIFGVRAVMEAIDAGKVLDKVLVRRDMSSAIGKELLIKLEGTGTQIQRVPLEKLNQFTDKNHQGVIAFLSPIEFTPLDSLVQSLYDEGKVPLLMLLDGVTDVRNFGAIARTCVCAGVHALIIGTRGSAAINGDAVKALVKAIGAANVNPVGFHCHIGSQIFDKNAFGLAVDKMTDFIKNVKDLHDFETQILNMGGGYGIYYTEGDPHFTLDEYADYESNFRKSINRNNNHE